MLDIVPEDEREHFNYRVVRQQVEVARCAARFKNGRQCTYDADYFGNGKPPLCDRHYNGKPLHTGRTDRSQ